MSTEPKTLEELAAESTSFAYYRQKHGCEHDGVGCGKICYNCVEKCTVAAIRKGAEQCRPYMQHLLLCKSIQHYGSCDCGLDSVLNTMK